MSGENIQIGSKLRDAAVDSQPGDYRPYVNDRVEGQPEIQVGTELRDAAVDPKPGDNQPYTEKGEHVNAIAWPPAGS
ncbi:hypothetical protein [Arthrobacter sp. NPDC056493]|uniref:hypothetical protein n=1 Tax=Arthrobacter sp. NPDC056493 TaxID=3345839 RepID=UPI0036717485